MEIFCYCLLTSIVVSAFALKYLCFAQLGATDYGKMEERHYRRLI